MDKSAWRWLRGQWTPGGMVQGGTGQALRMAQDHGIEIRNLGSPEVMVRAQRWLGLA